MVLYAYYDGSGKRDRKAMTLCGLAATEALWNEFNENWEQALDVNDVPDRLFSMTDLMASRKHFRGWKCQNRRALLDDLFKVIGSFRSRRLLAYSCTIFFDAYEEARERRPNLRKAEAICVNSCVGRLQLSEDEMGRESGFILLHFDRNEGFLHTVNQVWLKLKKRRSGWAMQVRDILPVDSSYYQIQAADLIAWILNAHRCRAVKHGRHPYELGTAPLNYLDRLHLQIKMHVNHYSQLYADAETILQNYAEG